MISLLIPYYVTTFLSILRSTASGVHLLMVRIGAIMGTYIFGMFSYSNVTVPVLTTASLLSIGAIMSIFLPWSTRRTALK